MRLYHTSPHPAWPAHTGQFFLWMALIAGLLMLLAPHAH